MAATSVLQLILKLKTKTFNKKLKAVKGNISSLKGEHVKAFSAMRDQFPMLGKGLDLITNKYVLMAAAMAGIGLLMFSATKKAANFNHEFLQIKQMNLDKPRAEMEAYKKDIRNAAFEIGTDLNDTTKAFYDLQSGTGLFGKKAVEVFKKVGNYSVATGADLNASMNATVKAMKAMGLGVNEIDGYLKSNAKTVQTGITTYAELAKVQTEYLGAAASAGQNIDVANKIFAGFTSIAKNSDTGANMAKTFFDGLKQSAGKFKNVLNIDLYGKDNKMLGADKILENIATKFKGMSDKEIDAAITKIGGPEGLRGMLAKVQTGADDLLNTFKSFDESKFDLSKALKNAKGDVTALGDIVKNRWNTVLAMLGERLLPAVAVGLNWVNNILMSAYQIYDKYSTAINTAVIAIGTIITVIKLWKIAQIALDVVLTANPIGLIIAAVAALATAIAYVISKTEGWSAQWDNLKQVMALAWEGMKLKFSLLTTSMLDKWMWLQNGIVKGYKWAQNLIGNLSDAQYKKDIAAIEKEDALRTAKIKGLKVAILENEQLIKKTAEWKLKWKSDKEEETTTDENGVPIDPAKNGLNNFNPSNPNSDTNIGNDIEKVVGAGNQVRNITVNIDSLNKGGINTANTTLAHMDADEISNWFSESMMRVIRGLELSN